MKGSGTSGSATERWEAGDYDVALLENEILERYFAPVLDTKTYAAPALSRWPAEQKADAQSARENIATAFHERGGAVSPRDHAEMEDSGVPVLTLAIAVLLLGLRIEKGGPTTEPAPPPTTDH